MRAYPYDNTLDRREGLGKMRPFRFRSTSRDLASDESRIKQVRQAIESAIASASKELVGLNSRLEMARRQAAMLVDNDDFPMGMREHSEDRLLSTVETRLVAAEQRAADLRRHLGKLQGLAMDFNREFD